MIMVHILVQGSNLALVFITTIIAAVACLILTRADMGKMGKNLRVEVVGIRPTCGNCGYTATIRDAVYCTRCGSGPLRSAMAESTLEAQLGMLDPQQCNPDSYIIRVRAHANEMAAEGRAAWASHTCKQCGTVVAVDDAQFCPACGEKLPIQVITAVIGEDRVETRISSRGTGDNEPVGTCLVCDLEMSRADVLATCPRCSNIFHKAHLISWVHVKKHCPVCGERLGESDIVALSNEKSMEGES
jgi:hypothetical protein